MVSGGAGECVDLGGRVECRFEEVREVCPGEEICFDGQCVAPPPDPCDGVDCDEPPAEACGEDGRSIVRSAPAGACQAVAGEAVCRYDTDVVACGDEICVDAACVAIGVDPCDPNPCQNAPDSRCEVGGGAVFDFEAPGRCVDADGQPLCEYDPQRRPCEGGQVCEGGRCVDPQPDPCFPDPCDRPPPAECTPDAQARIVYAQGGECQNNNGQASCEYVGQRQDCPDDRVCRDGLCQPVGEDPCEPNPCVNRPVAQCSGDNRLVFEGVGACSVVTGRVECAYDSQEEACPVAEICNAGQCMVEDACEPNPCVGAPQDECADQRTVRSFSAPGACRQGAGGQPECRYDPEEALCAAGQVCLNGGCIEEGEDPCDPNPCSSPPEAACDADGGGVRRFANEGICLVVDERVRCTYEEQHEDCEGEAECRDGVCEAPNPCLPNPCVEAGLPFCGFDGRLVVPQAPGVCEVIGVDALCTYPEQFVVCDEGLVCRFDQCVEDVPDPCDPNPCDEPPASRCNGEGWGVICCDHTGVCQPDGGEAQCQYFQSVQDCEADEVCIDAECVPLGDDPCDPNPCQAPPDPVCDFDGNRRVFSAPGTCEPFEGRPQCQYDFESAACPGEQVCVFGACEDPPEDACNPNPCDAPPPAECSADAGVRVFSEVPGFCIDLGGEALCDYFEQREACAADEVCIDAECVALGEDVCDPNPCQNPQPADCLDGQLRAFEAPGLCEDLAGQPQCTYPPQLSDCDVGLFCQGGECVDGALACEPNPCNLPPNSECDEDGRLVRFAALGGCELVDGEVSCTYEREVVDCPPGDRCNFGQCELDPAQVEAPDEAGDLVINEIMYHPEAPLDSAGAEWFELYNPSGAPLDLQGCRVRTGSGETEIGAQLVMRSGGYLLLGRSADFLDNGGLSPDVLFDFDLSDAGATLSVVCGGVTIDEVTYDDAAPWPAPAVRRSLNLDLSARTAGANDAPASWCLADEADQYFFDFANNNHHAGTPGAVNSGCPTPVDFCRLQFPLEVLADAPGEQTTYFGRYFHENITDQSAGNDAFEGLRAQLGFGPDGSDPEVDFAWQWTNAEPTPNWNGANFGEPNNDEYRVVLAAPFPGTYDFAFRFSVDGGRTFTYCDGGDEGSSDGYQIANAGHLVVPQGGGGDLCDPNPCQSPPQGECVGNTARAFVPIGQCQVVDGQADCEYAVEQELDCEAQGQVCRNGLCADDDNQVDFCRYQHPANANVSPGDQITIYGRVFEPGITDQTAGTDVDPQLQSQGGYGPDGSDPAGNGNWEWFVGSANLLYDGNAPGAEPNNDEYEVIFNAPAAGDYDMAYRFTLDGGQSWVYCDGGDIGSNDGYQPANAGQMSVVP